jgi:hypothetical protein
VAESISKLRAATLDDAEMVAELETARLPDDPRDGAMVAFGWTHAGHRAGSDWLRTDNDSENGPILHLSAEMGHRPAAAHLELHRDL